MNEDYKPLHRKAYEFLKLMTAIIMSLLFIGVGAIVLLAERFQLQTILQYPNVLRYFFAFICFLYGGFRLYRGIKKDY